MSDNHLLSLFLLGNFLGTCPNGVLSSRETESRLDKCSGSGELWEERCSQQFLSRLVRQTSGQKQSEGPDVEISREGRSSQVLRE